MSKHHHSIPEDHRATLTWSGIRAVAVTKDAGEKVLLNDITGDVQPGQMAAIMGPSGCGKTTLLDTLAGRTPKNIRVAGDILVNGRATKMSYGTVAYVPQEDLLTGTLTVRETLQFTSRLRLKMSTEARHGLVDDTLHQLGLVAAADAPVGTLLIKGISGGQKRRLSIACEVLVGPAMLFLDEPTSGLDAAAAFFCATALRVLASQGRTIVMSIHQPSVEVFNLFDTLLLLSGGEMIFFGTADRASEFYSNAGLPCPPHRSPPDHFIHCMNVDFTREAADFADERESASNSGSLIPATRNDGASRAEHADGAGAGGSEKVMSMRVRGSLRELNVDVPFVDAEVGIKTLRAHYMASQKAEVDARVAMLAAAAGRQHSGIVNDVSAASQCLTLTHRALLNSYRDIGVFWIRIAMYIGLSLCLGTVYFGLDKSWPDTSSRGGLIMFSFSFLTFMAISGFPSFVEEMRVVMRERLNNYYGIGPYTVANTVASIPFLAVIAISCSILIVYLADLGTSGEQVIYFIISLFSALFAVESLMMAIAAIVPHYLIGLAAGAALLGTFMPVAGYIIPIDELPKPVWRYPFHYLGFHTYAIHGTMFNEFKGTDGWGCPCELEPEGCDNPQCSLDGDEVLEALNYTQDRSKWWDVAIMLFMAVLFRVFFFSLLKLREARSK